MDTDLLRAVHADPADETVWLAVADWLEEAGDARCELVRLTHRLRREPAGKWRQTAEARVREFLASGQKPVVASVMNSLGMVFGCIPPGTFHMGSPFNEPYHSYDEGPVHEVEITRPFYLGLHPVTQGEYARVMGTNPSHFAPGGPLPYYRLTETNTTHFPVDSVEFGQAVEFCRRLSAYAAEREAGRRYRLPTEAEWEYACRAGTSTIFYCGDSLSSHQANFDGNYSYGGASRHAYLKRTCPVGSYPPNPFGLYDMYGNVWEWCSDWFAEQYYSESPREDPTGPKSGSHHVLRGGSWIDAGWHCRSADRSHREALHYVGFRVALEVG